MPTFKIASWNVNSLRVRLPHLLSWLQEVEPDVVALQETKLPDADFPSMEIVNAGYTPLFSGQKTYNGVALLIKQKNAHDHENIITAFPTLEDIQRRVLAVTVNGIRIVNLYIPNGEALLSEKYQYKLNWLSSLDSFLKAERDHHPNYIILGDFNIAPTEMDVHDPKEWEGQVLCSEPEREAFRTMLATGFTDCFRQLNPQEKSYSWWDYRMNSFKRNRGLRIDHILASTSLASQCVKCYIDKTLRTLERPSDHAPVVAEFAIGVDKK